MNIQVNSNDFVNKVGDFIYLDPMLIYGLEENPFKDSVRYYPIDFGYPEVETYSEKVKIPEEYELESMPESIRTRNPAGDLDFSFNVEQYRLLIQLTSSFHRKSALYSPRTYPTIRLVYDHILKCHAEQIVLKKKE